MVDIILLVLLCTTLASMLVAWVGEVTEHLTVALVGLTGMVTGMALFGAVLTVDTIAALIECPPATPDWWINTKLWISELGLASVGLLAAIGGISQMPNVIRCWLI